MAPMTAAATDAPRPVLLGRDLTLSNKQEKTTASYPPASSAPGDLHEYIAGLAQRRGKAVVPDEVLSDFMQHFIGIFAGKDYAAQPAHLVHIGAGNGRLLQLVYEHVKKNTPRGKVLSKHPLTAVAVEARSSARTMLNEDMAQNGFPHAVVDRDASSLGELPAALRLVGVDTSRALFVSTADQVCEYRGPENTALEKGSPSAALADAQLTDFVQLDGAGRRAPAGEVLASALEHFQGWVRLIHGSFGLCMLEAPAPSANDSQATDVNGNEPSSRRCPLPAAAMAMTAAMAGLMPLRPKKVYAYPPRDLQCAVLSQHLVERPFQIRLATTADIDSLVRLEHLAWDANLVAPREVLLRRLHVSPTTCFVCEMEGRVVACLYTQRINSTDDIFNETFMDVSSSHVPGGRVVQLLAISSDPEVSKLGIGSDLRCVALHLARLDPGVDTVCAVTRARNYKGFNGTMEEYCEAHTTGKLLDPILDFHTGYGAKIVSCVHKYRPEDTDNKAIGVLIQYQIRNLPGSVQHEGQRGAGFGNEGQKGAGFAVKGPAPVPVQKAKTARVTALQLLRNIMKDIGYPVDENNLGKGFFDYDMDSLELVQVRNKLGQALGKELPATLLLDFPSVQSLADELDGDLADEDDDDDDEDVVAQPPPLPSAKSSKSSPAVPSREVLSKLFADIGQSIDGEAFDQGFFDLDLDSLDLVRVKNQLGQTLSLELPPTLLLDFPTSRALVQYLDKVRGLDDEDEEEDQDLADQQASPQQQQQQQQQQQEAEEGPRRKGQGDKPSADNLSWAGMTVKQYALMQKELLQVLGKPRYQQRFCELAKTYCPDFRKEYVLAIEPLIIEASGPIFVKRGLAKSCEREDVQEARARSWRCLRHLCEDGPQLLKNTDMLIKITRQDGAWGF